MRHDEVFRFRVAGRRGPRERWRFSMSPSDQTAPNFDPEAVRDKYARERAKRMTESRGVIHDLKRDEGFAEYTRDPFTPFVEREPVIEDVDVAIIGAGMSGVVMG